MILHAIPEFAFTWPGSGNWKAVHATAIALQSLGIPVKRVTFRGEDAGAVVDACAPDVTDVIVEYSYWGWLIRRLACERPHVRVHVRTHNAEALQHWSREHPSVRAPARMARCVYGCLRMLWQDTFCARYAYSLLGISPWETRHYWRYLCGCARLEDMPYFCPWPALGPGVESRPWSRREQVILCLPGGLRGRFHRDQVDGLDQLAKACRRLGAPYSGWTFGCSRGVGTTEPLDWKFSGISLLPSTDNVWELLHSVRAVAVLSDLGFGLKTTVVDALAAGCNVMLKQGLWRRLPPAVQEFCIPCVSGSSSSVGAALQRADRDVSGAYLNQSLHDEVVRVLRGVLAGAQGG